MPALTDGSDNLRRRAAPAIRRWLTRWDQPDFADDVRLVVSPRLTRSLARALPQANTIRLSRGAASLPPRMLSAVICHELAHLAAFRRWGRSVKPHGPEWASLVRSAGFQPVTRLSVTEPLSAQPSRATLRFTYRCPVCHAKRVTRRRSSRWRCAACVVSGLSGEMTLERGAAAQ